MIDIRIKEKTTGEVVFEHPFPSNSRECRLDQAIQFWVAERDSKKDNDAFPLTMVKAIAAFCDKDYHDLLNVKLGESSGPLDSGAVAPIYKLIVDNILKHQQRLYSKGEALTYKGQTFMLPHLLLRENGDAIEYSDLSVLEVVELEEILKAAKGNPDEEGFVTAEQWYSDYLNLLAVLLRPPGSLLPADGTERLNYINEQRKFWMDVDLETALNIDFFLTSSENGLREVAGPTGSLTSALLSLWAESVTQNLTPSKTPKGGRKKRSAGRGSGGSTRHWSGKGRLRLPR